MKFELNAVLVGLLATLVSSSTLALICLQEIQSFHMAVTDRSVEFATFSCARISVLHVDEWSEYSNLSACLRTDPWQVISLFHVFFSFAAAITFVLFVRIFNCNSVNIRSTLSDSAVVIAPLDMLRSKDY